MTTPSQNDLPGHFEGVLDDILVGAAKAFLDNSGESPRTVEGFCDWIAIHAPSLRRDRATVRRILDAAGMVGTDQQLCLTLTPEQDQERLE